MESRLARGPGFRVAAVLTGLATVVGLLLGSAGPAQAEQANHPGDPRVVELTDTTVSLSWAPAPRPADVLHYRVVKNGGTNIGTTTGTSFTVTRLVPDRQYSFAVEAISRNSGGWSSNHIPVRTTGTTPSMPAKPVVMGVFTEKGSHERGFHVKDLVTGGSAAKLTHLTYGYGTVGGGACRIGDENAALERSFTAGNSVSGRADTASQPLRGHLNQLRELKERYPRLKVLWSFGGPDQVGDWAGARENPAAFAESCAQLVNDPRWAGLFDGVDLAMEFPACHGATCELGAPASVTALTRELRSALGADRLLTVTIGRDGYGRDSYGRADLVGAASHLDWYNVKAFDYYRPLDALWDDRPAPHAPLYSWETWEWGKDVHYDMWTLTEQGLHPNKLVLGIPTHAWGWNGVVARPWPGGFVARGPASGALGPGLEDYRTVSTRCAPTGELGKTVYALCGDEYWTYDTPATVTKKTVYMKHNGLGGAFVSNLRGDSAGGELLTALSTALSP